MSGYIYLLDGSTTAGKAAPADILTLKPIAGSVVKVIGIKLPACRAPTRSGLVTFSFGGLSSDVTGSTLTPIPHDQNLSVNYSVVATTTAKGTVTGNGGTLTRITQWSAQQVSSSLDLWVPWTLRIVARTEHLVRRA